MEELLEREDWDGAARYLLFLLQRAMELLGLGSMGELLEFINERARAPKKGRRRRHGRKKR